MQAVHIAAAAIPPAVAAHLRNQKTPGASCGPGLPGQVGFGNGGGVSPVLRKHLAVALGGNCISPPVRRHLAQFGPIADPARAFRGHK